MHGITKSITASFNHIGTGISLLDKKTKLTGFEGGFTIKRSDFGMKYGLPDVLGDELRMTISVEASIKNWLLGRIRG